MVTEQPRRVPEPSSSNDTVSKLSGVVCSPYVSGCFACLRHPRGTPRAASFLTLGDYAPVMAPFRLLSHDAAHRAARLHAIGTARVVRVIEEEFV